MMNPVFNGNKINLLQALTLSFLLAPNFLFAADFTGRVVGISDGDTISVMHDGRAEKIRLSGIDCPEKKQPFGHEPSSSPPSWPLGNMAPSRRSAMTSMGERSGM
jgi:endonuclease YncB( thermonuclease family)